MKFADYWEFAIVVYNQVRPIVPEEQVRAKSVPWLWGHIVWCHWLFCVHFSVVLARGTTLYHFDKFDVNVIFLNLQHHPRDTEWCV